MANRTNESDDDFDILDEDIFADDEELDYDDEEDDGDEEFSIESLTPSERKRYEKMRQQIEDSVVDAIAKGDPNSGAYKGLQKVLSKRDRELAETRNALASVMAQMQTFAKTGSDVEFLRNIMKDMLDDESKQLFDEKFNQFNDKRESQQNKAILDQILQQQQAQNLGYTRYGADDEDEKIAQYRREATAKLKNFAKKAGVDPDSSGLDYGDESEPLLTRMDKLATSIEKAQESKDEEEIVSVRRKVPRNQTRTDNVPAPRDGASGSDLLARGSAKIINQFRKL